MVAVNDSHEHESTLNNMSHTLWTGLKMLNAQENNDNGDVPPPPPPPPQDALPAYRPNQWVCLQYMLVQYSKPQCSSRHHHQCPTATILNVINKPSAIPILMNLVKGSNLHSTHHHQGVATLYIRVLRVPSELLQGVDNSKNSVYFGVCAALLI
jgi:hypothetical protein